ncbi:hypothetical protein L1049_002626 [Liquidambar formosana]|uniref:Uncharacterized protein n=1 Tax=Liquidambar formosana TaxID=63359 RepID=A0AAP0NI91_LIQFO
MWRVRGTSSASASPSPSSSPPPAPFPALPEEGLEKSICFWAYNDDLYSEFYVFSLSSNDFVFEEENSRKREKKMTEEKKTTKKPLIHHHDGDNEYGMGKLRRFSSYKGGIYENCIALGRIIYHFGGSYRFSRKVRCLDTSRPEQGWKKGHRMISHRREPCAVVLDGKLYIMGGTDPKSRNPETWAEVFDPCLRKWEPLPPLPSPNPPANFNFVFAALDVSKKILVGFPESSVVYMYDVVKKSWEEWNHDLMTKVDSFHRLRPAVVGHTLYWSSSYGEIYAYDLDLKMWSVGSVQGFEEEEVMCRPGDFSFYPCLLHLCGEDFCFLWSQPERRIGQLHMRSHCIKLQVSKCINSEGQSSTGKGSQGALSAVIRSCQSYFVDHNLCFTGGLVLDGRVERESIISQSQQLEQLGSSRSLIITGHSLGGSIASLFTLWLLENVNPSTTKRPLCITFGSPFIGDNGLQQAISQRPTWNSCFLHVASNHDPIPRVFISPQNPTETTIYKPFGTFLLCSELGYACFEDPKSILELLVETGLESAGSQDPNEGSRVIDYGPILKHLKHRALVKGISEWFTDQLQTGIVTQLKAIGAIKTQLEQLGISRSLIITGHSLGGSIASLFTLWLLENLDPSTTKRPLCITFGSPFIGDNGFQQAISQLSTWNSCFLHIASNQDPIPRLFISTVYKPFGTFLLCSELGSSSFEDPDLILGLLVAMGLETAQIQDSNVESHVIDYGTILEHLKRRALVKGISEWFTDPHRAGIVTQLEAIGVIRTQNEREKHMRKNEDKLAC